MRPAATYGTVVGGSPKYTDPSTAIVRPEMQTRLLSVMRVAQDPERDRIAPIDVRPDERLERAVEVRGQATGQLVIVHHHPEHAWERCRCTREA